MAQNNGRDCSSVRMVPHERMVLVPKPHPKGSSRRSIQCLMALALMTIIAAGGCGSSKSGNSTDPGKSPAGSAANVRIGAKQPREIISRITPQRHSSTITTLATQRGRGGVWAWDVGSDSEAPGTPHSRIWHYDAATGKTRSWSIGTSGAALGGIATPALAACGKSTWFGSKHSLIELDPSTGSAKRYTVPPVTTVPEVDATLPKAAEVRTGVQSIACSDETSGIVIALSNANAVLYFDTIGHNFRSIPLPSHTSSTEIATDGKGHAAVGLQVFGSDGVGHPTELELLDLKTNATKTVHVADAAHVVARHGSFIAGDVTDANRVQPMSGTVAKVAATPSVDADPSIGAAQTLPDGRYVVASKAGLRIIDPTGKTREVEMSLGKVACFNGGEAPDGSPLPTSPPGKSCPVEARVLVVDDLGNVFFVPSAGTPAPVEQIVVTSAH